MTSPTSTGTPASRESAASAASVEALPPSDNITELREEIDRLDAEILRMILRRSEVSQQIGA
ncbi:MAG: hypothetical protein QOI75_2763, partial [Pseudonocardiales bacterium]|nr:hypothetical protein [Pseudonocardiales bacterium]